MAAPDCFAGYCLLLSLCTPASALAFDAITLLYNDRPPYIVAQPDGSAAGLTATPAGNAFKAAGVPVVWKKFPTNRQIATIKDSDGRNCAIGWFKNREREQFAKFTKPIYLDRPTVLIAHHQFVSRPNETLLDIMSRKDVSVLIKDQFSYGAYIDGLLSSKRGGLVVTTNDNLQMVEMVRIHRADFMFAAEEEARYLIEQAGHNLHDFQIVRPPDMPPGERRYIMCSKQVEDELIARLNMAINAQ